MERSDDRGEWRRVYESLRDDIVSGRLRPGEDLPAQNELAVSMAVSRHAVRRAIGMLVEQEALVAGQGARARVAEAKIALPVSSRTRFSDSVNRLGLHGSHELLAVRRRTPPVRIARLLDMTRLRPVQVAEILRRANGAPVSVSRHYFAEGVPPIEAALRVRPSVTAALRMVGIADFIRERTLVESRTASAHEGLLLGMTPGRHVVCTVGRNVTPDRSPLEVSESVFRSDSVTLVFMPPDQDDPGEPSAA